jgi:hypothetical protein
MADTIDNTRTVMQPRNAQKRQLRGVKKLRSMTPPSAPTSPNAQMPRLARVRQQRADQGKKQPARALAGSVVVTRAPKVLVARLGQLQQHGGLRAIVARSPAGATIARPDKVVAARSAQRSQLKTVRMSAMKAATPPK